MQQKKLDHFKRILQDMRDRITGEAEHVADAIADDSSSNLSHVPLHLADVATEAIDAGVHVLSVERGMLAEIEGALGRIERGVFGKCQACGSTIAEERLQAIPYAPLCIACAQTSRP